ncbi:MAG TPA: MFS transporter [Opitutaceae bacterium]|nr:MFS transporter [Opitutaceae bacterium]
MSTPAPDPVPPPVHSERSPGVTGGSVPWWRLLNRHHWTVFTIASLAWLFDCLDGQVFNLARDGAMEHLLADPKKATILAPYTTSVFLLGWAGGGLIFGALGDRFGRARILTIAIAVYSLTTGLNAFATGFGDFCAYRFITGLGVGGVFGLAVALVADTVPDETRAPALGLLQSLSTWGNLAAGFIGMAIGAAAVHEWLPWHLRPWQALFLLGALPALLSVVVLRRLREPEKWVRARAEGRQRGVRFGSYAVLLRHPRWRRHAWFGLIACSAGIIGLWGIGNFHPKIVGSIIEHELAARHLSPEAMSSEKAFWRAAGLLLQNVGGFCGMMTLAKVAQCWGRRIAFALALLLSFLTTILVFRFMRTTTDMYWMLPAMGFGQLSVFSVYAIYLPELFPTSLRSTGTSFCYNVGRIIAATAPFTLSRITESLGGNVEAFRTAGLWVSLLLLVGIPVLPLLPETKGQPLPEE